MKFKINFKNNIIMNEMEPFQKNAFKKHPKRKNRLIGKGGNKYMDPGMSRPDMQRSKSAPPLGENNEHQFKIIVQENEYYDLKSFKIHKHLYPKFFEKKKLIPEIKNKLIKIAKEFINTFPEKYPIVDITITGSIANYNWSDYSDIDLHIIVDMKQIDSNHKLTKDYFNVKRKEWNNQHQILLNQHEVEIYVQDSIEEHFSTGVYSLLKDDWIVKPNPHKPTFDEKQLYNKTNNIVNQIHNIEKLYEKEEYKKAETYSKRLFDKIKKFRKIGLEKHGEFSIENLTFKALRRGNFLELLNNIKNNSYDKLLGNNEPAKRDY